MLRSLTLTVLMGVLLALSTACKKGSESRSRSDAPQTATAPARGLPRSAAAASDPPGAADRPGPQSSLPIFVEVVLEVDDRPPSARVHIVPEPRRLPVGYVLRKITPSFPARLYPATGRARSETGRQTLWVGTRFRNHLADRPEDRLTLRSTDRPDLTLVSKHAKGGSDPWLRVYPGPLPIVTGPGGVVTVGLGDTKARLEPGRRAVLSSRRVEIDRGRWADAIAARATAAGAVPGGRKAALAALARSFPGDGAIVLFTRTTVIHHGRVAVAAFDVQHQWKQARRAAAEGPYEQAEETLERVLEAAPAYRPAVDALVEVTRLLDAGISPGRLSGKLVFGPGTPTARHKALWKEHHPGFVTLTGKGEREGKATYTAQIANGAFRIDAPQGAYRLVVMVPGFGPVRRDVTVKGEQSIAIRLPK